MPFLRVGSVDRDEGRRINKLIEAAMRDLFEGIGKPEPLRGNLADFWSRRIDNTNRLVYAVDNEYLTIISCRYHYSD
jgi:toxin YoeB